MWARFNTEGRYGKRAICGTPVYTVAKAVFSNLVKQPRVIFKTHMSDALKGAPRRPGGPKHKKEVDGARADGHE